MNAAVAKYHEKPLILEGTVAEIKVDADRYCYTFFLAGPDEKAAKPVRVVVDCRTVGEERIRQQLATVQKGRMVKIKSDAVSQYDRGSE